MTDNLASEQAAGGRSPWRVLGWVLLGGVIGAAVVLAFIAYNQPGLLLEQMNLRYCG